MKLGKVVGQSLPVAVTIVGVQMLAPALTRWGTAVIRATVTEVRSVASEAQKVADVSGRPASASERAGRETKA